MQYSELNLVLISVIPHYFYNSKNFLIYNFTRNKGDWSTDLDSNFVSGVNDKYQKNWIHQLFWKCELATDLLKEGTALLILPKSRSHFTLLLAKLFYSFQLAN